MALAGRRSLSRLTACGGVALLGVILTGLGLPAVRADDPPHSPVGDLRVTLVAYPRTIKIQWDYQQFGAWKYQVKRGEILVVSAGTLLYYQDTLPISGVLGDGTDWDYSVRVVPDPGQPYVAGPWETIRVRIGAVDALENQAVDSRYDLRYSSPTFQDFKFGSRAYRGGLYAGNAPDPSRAGRSFIKWQLPALAADHYFWCGLVHAYHTRSFATGSTNVGVHLLGDSTWNASTLKWTTAPAINPATPSATCTLAWDSAVPHSSQPDPTLYWGKWDLSNAIFNALTGTGWLSVGLASTDESAAGWAYFAKKEYVQPGVRTIPTVLYGYQRPGTPPAPNNLAAVVNTFSLVRLNWNRNGANYRMYEVQRRTGAGAFATIANVGDAQGLVNMAYDDTTVSASTTYTYRVRFESSLGSQKWFYSNSIVVTTPAV